MSDFGKFLEIGRPNVMQHLTLLRNYRVIDFYMDGKLGKTNENKTLVR
ncbi:MAG: hypothetical protein HQL01_07155 [Nitrospirae bacterium]|nr:hypothetical protein [Nitrospirota bacterium]